MRSLPSSHKKAKRRKKGCFGRILSLLLIGFCIFLLGKIFFAQSGLKEKILQTQYPIKYQELVHQYAKQYDLQEPMVYALIRTESKFDPYAVSETGACGLMQIQRATAEDCAKELNMVSFSSDDLFEPETNIRIGCYYFSKLLKQFNGNKSLAIAAYNGGPGNIQKWMQEEAYTDENGALIHIPFSETRNYVTRVTKAYEVYCSLYPNIK